MYAAREGSCSSLRAPPAAAGAREGSDLSKANPISTGRNAAPAIPTKAGGSEHRPSLRRGEDAAKVAVVDDSGDPFDRRRDVERHVGGPGAEHAPHGDDRIE